MLENLPSREIFFDSESQTAGGHFSKNFLREKKGGGGLGNKKKVCNWSLFRKINAYK